MSDAMRERATNARRAIAHRVDALVHTTAGRCALAALALARVLSVCQPTPESFHAHCVRQSRDVIGSTGFTTKAWACSNGGLLRVARLVGPAYSTSDLGILTFARVERTSTHFVGFFGTWIRVPRTFNLLPAIVIHVYRIHATILALLAAGIIGMMAMRVLKLVKVVLTAAVGGALALWIAPKVFGVPLWSLALSGGIWAYLFKTQRWLFDGLSRTLKALAPPPKRGRRAPPPPPPPPRSPPR